jgi:hypothetical protein
MVITYHGLEFFRINFGDTALALNPISKDSKHKSPSFGADIVLISHKDRDFNGFESVSRGDKAPFLISGPGEYEIKGVFIKGFGSVSDYNGSTRPSTFYTIELEDASLCFLGPISSTDLKDELDDLKRGADILFVPIGGEGVLEASQAYKLAVSLEPKVIIPMHFGSVGKKDSLKAFLKEGGEENSKAVDKLTLRKKDLAGKEGEIIVLSQV